MTCPWSTRCSREEPGLSPHPHLSVQVEGGVGMRSHNLGINADCPCAMPGPHPSTH